MRLDGSIFAIEQRSVGGCLDLAVVFFREHFFQIMQLVAYFAVPFLALTWWLIDSQGWTLSGCAMLFYLLSPYLGAALVTSAGHRVFGDQFSPRIGIKAVVRRFFFFTFLLGVIKLAVWMGFFAFIFPAYLVSTRYGFLPEVLFLENCPARKYEARLSDLLQQNFRNMVGRLVVIVAFFGAMVTSLFITVDLTTTTLFNYPILFKRFSGFMYVEEELMTYLTVDARVATVLLGIAWFIYPIARLAWMFCYLDLRIRKEGWDIEIDFRIEARRLEAAA